MSILEKGGGTFEGIKLLLCENSLSPIEAVSDDITAFSVACDYRSQLDANRKHRGVTHGSEAQI